MRVWKRVVVGALLAALVGAAAVRCEASLQALLTGWGKAWELGALFFPPKWSESGEMVRAAGETLMMALTGTLLGAVAAIGAALAASSNLVPGPVRMTVRVLMGIERSLPEILTVLFLVAAFGIGPLAGVLGLAVASVGMLGKLLADAVEETEPTLLEAVRATGASWSQVVRYAVLPEVLPALLGNTLFRFEVNVRNSVILGAVGAGGIGQEIFHSMGMLEYDRATLAVIASFALVLSAERLSEFLRSRLLREGAA
jgi:phosphonate transport system permease protein